MKGAFWMICILTLLEMIKSEADFHRLQIEGNSTFGYYYMSLLIGNPPQKQQFLLDTGSSFTTLTCSDCSVCDSSPSKKIFNSQRSFTNKKTKCKSRVAICQDRCNNNNQYCQFKNLYQDGSNNIGVIVQDQIGFQENKDDNFKAYFGCKKYSRDHNEMSTNGLLGLAPVPSENIFYQWFNSKPGRPYQFSICLAKNSGYFQIGKSPQPQANALSINYKSTAHHYIITNISTIRYGKRNILSKPLKQIAFDTGSTISYLPLQNIEILYQQLKSACQRIKNCRYTSQIQNGCFFYQIRGLENQDLLNQLNKYFPVISIQLDGQKFDWLPQNQFMIYDLQNTNVYKALCLGVKESKVVNLLGANWMKNRKFTFDLNQQKILIANNQECKYVPYFDENKNDFYTMNIKEAVQSISKFIEQYWILVLTAFFLILYLLKNKIQAVMGKVKQFFGRKAGRDKEQQKGTSEAIENQSSSLSNTQESKQEKIQLQ